MPCYLRHLFAAGIVFLPVARASAKRQGCTTQMVVYPRTPRGIEEPKLLVDCMHRNLRWFDKHVRGK